MSWWQRLLGRKSQFELMLDHFDRMHQREVDVIRAQQQTLDRIVAARYDRPVIEQTAPLPALELTAAELVDVDTEDAEWLEQH